MVFTRKLMAQTEHRTMSLQTNYKPHMRIHIKFFFIFSSLLKSPSCHRGGFFIYFVIILNDNFV